MIGEKFGKLRVESYFGKNDNNQNVWKCVCDCGNSTIVSSANLKNGSTQSCGCLRFKQSPKENLIGKTFNRLTVTGLSNKRSKEGRFLWECKCDCGNNTPIYTTSNKLKSGSVKSCGCLLFKREKAPIDLAGKIFGRLTVLSVSNERATGKQILWSCKCECGNNKDVTTSRLVSGVAKSCGCLKENPESPYKKDEIFIRLIKVWQGMKKRCTNEKYEGYKYYGGRGISVSDEWQSFRPFYEWAILSGYKKGLQIDRIDVNGHYEPLNCRWVTPKENSQNKRNNKYLTINSETKTISEWAIQIGVTIKTLTDRINRGWKDTELLLLKRERNNIRKYSGELLTINEITKAFSEWAETIGISYATLRDRVNADWSDDELIMPKGYRRHHSNKK